MGIGIISDFFVVLFVNRNEMGVLLHRETSLTPQPLSLRRGGERTGTEVPDFPDIPDGDEVGGSLNAELMRS